MKQYAYSFRHMYGKEGELIVDVMWTHTSCSMLCVHSITWFSCYSVRQGSRFICALPLTIFLFSPQVRARTTPHTAAWRLSWGLPLRLEDTTAALTGEWCCWCCVGDCAYCSAVWLWWTPCWACMCCLSITDVACFQLHRHMGDAALATTLGNLKLVHNRS